MILSTNEELRLHLPSNAVDDVMLIQGILDNSEKDFLRDKLGTALYDKLCEYYINDAGDFYQKVMNGEHTNDAWATLLLNAQRMIANDAMSRYLYQQAISINSSGVNVASSNDYDAADSKLLDKGVSAFHKEAMIALNTLLVCLEYWAEQVKDEATETEDETTSPEKEIVDLWKQSKYYYLHSDLLIPTAQTLQQYVDIYDNREKFIRLLPDLHFIQDEYIADFIGEDLLTELRQSTEQRDKRIMKKATLLMVRLLVERTSVIAFDKQTRATAHDDAISLRTSLQAMLKAREEELKAAEKPTVDNSGKPEPPQGEGYKNNRPGSKIFVSPMIY